MCYIIAILLVNSIALNIFYLCVARPSERRRVTELRERIRKTIEKMDENHERSARMLKTYRDIIDQLTKFLTDTKESTNDK